MQTKDNNMHAEEESINYSSVMRDGRKMGLNERLESFSQSMEKQHEGEQHLYLRLIDSPTDRTVMATDNQGKTREMLMFGSNNYLGFANHPYIEKKVKKAIRKYGVGIAGPPLLNGYSKLMKELEERLSNLKGTEDTLIFSSGYNANLGLINGACTRNDIIIADEYNHASFFDGVRLIKGKFMTFKHNDMQTLSSLLETTDQEGDKFIAVEGVYSMDGDIAPLNEIIQLAQKHQAQIIIDDAHGTGVLGFNGEGAMEELGIKWSNEIIMGTFSKAFAVNGGFISGSKALIDYIRFMARPYMFSASLPPVTLAAVLAGLDLVEHEPWRRVQLKKNVSSLARQLKRFGISVPPRAGIVSLNVPEHANIRKMANEFNREGIFLNAIEFPAVPRHKQRFRISVSTNHTDADLQKLTETVDKIWYENDIDLLY